MGEDTDAARGRSGRIGPGMVVPIRLLFMTLLPVQAERTGAVPPEWGGKSKVPFG